MIHINSNDPEQMKARQNVKPLTMEEENYIIETLNKSFESKTDEDKDAVVLKKQAADLLQLLIYRYENLKYFYHVIGGWEGLRKNLDAAAKISTGLLTNDDISEIQKEADEIISRGFSSSEELERYRKEAYSEDEKTAAREAQIKNVSQAIDDVENYDKVHFTHEVNLQTGEEKIVELGNWIDVKDRLPENEGYYLCYIHCPENVYTDRRGTEHKEEEGDYIDLGLFLKVENEWDIDTGRTVYEISHWQPLPEPPKTLKFNIPKP